MPYGSGRIVQQALMHATPWQRYLIGVAMVAGGVVLVLVGRTTGGLLAVAGVFLLWRMVRVRRRRSQATAEAAQPGDVS
jgi:hypothetical protein